MRIKSPILQASSVAIFAQVATFYAGIGPVAGQAISQTPAIAQPVPDQGDPPANPPASNPPAFVETSSGTPSIGLTDAEFQTFTTLSDQLATNLGRKDDIKDEFDTLSNVSIGLYTIGSATQRPGESDADFQARRMRQDALKTEWNTLNDQNRDINSQLKPLAKQIRQNTTGVRCADQLTDAIYGVSVAGAAVSLAGDIAEAATSPTAPVGGEIAGNILSAIGTGLDVTSLALEGTQNTLPNCEGVFTGTVQTYANFISKMGLSAFDGNITIGYPGSNDPNNPSELYYQGITLGGGGLAGAGAGGAQAFTGHVSAIAIGNGARAEAEDSTAIGNGARATQLGATAIGAHSEATGLFSTAIGYHANAFGENAIAIGNTATAAGTNGVAIGTGTVSGDGNNNTAIGTGITIADGSNNNTVLGVGHGVSGDGNFVAGDPNETYGNGNAVVGNDNFTLGNNNQVLGNNNGTLGTVIGGIAPDGNETPGVLGDNNSVVGSGNRIGFGAALANGNKVFGDANQVDGDNNVVVGTLSQVDADNGIAIGTAASVIGGPGVADGNIAIGSQSSVAAVASLAVGSNATVGVAAQNSAAIGQGASVAAESNNSLAVGQGATAADGSATALGQSATAIGRGTSAVGTAASAAAAVGSSVFGSGATADASVLSTAVGVGATADSTTGASAFGVGATVAANTTGGTAAGFASNARADGATAYGNQADASGTSSTAIGQDSRALADGSAAFGTGAVASMQDQQVFGTADNTYTMRGITSDRSESRQSGPLQLVTTDANGNLASDNGETFTTIAKLQAGIAIALAGETPQLATNENFGIRLGWGNYEGEANAVAASAVGVLCRGCFTNYDRISLDGAFGVGWSGYKTYSAGSTVGGRAGVSWTW